MSKMIDGLVERGFIERQVAKNDRRRVPLKLTKKGAALHIGIWELAEKKIESERLPLLEEAEQEKLLEALEFLDRIFKQYEKNKT